MSAGLALLAGAAAGAVLGASVVRLDVAAWLLHLYARLLGASWYSPRQWCPRCGRVRHMMRHDPAREGAWSGSDSGLRCRGCSRRHPVPAPGRTETAPERTESAEVGLGVLGWDGAPAGTQGHAEPSAIQDRTDERNDHA